jgi:SAM-dependent methyltransferase
MYSALQVITAVTRLGTVEESCESLIEEAEAAPIEGWDFSWLDGRATEERPSWGYSRLLAERAKDVSSMLDIETGGGELLGQLPQLPPLTVATEGWEPNVHLAARRLQPRRASVVFARDDRPTLPFGSETFDLVVSRHPVATWWDEIARVLRPNGRYLSQQIGPHSMREVTEFLMGPQTSTSPRSPELAREKATTAGLRVDGLKMESLRATFADVGAVVFFLRLVVWIVPDFSVERYRDRLTAMHHEIMMNGPFVSHATRFLIEATKPG